MNSTYIYSIDSDNLKKLGVMKSIEIMDKISSSQEKDIEDISLFFNDIYKPMIKINHENEIINNEQMDFIKTITGKDVYDYERKDMIFTKDIKEKENWRCKDGDILLSNKEARIIIEGKIENLGNVNENLLKKIEKDFSEDKLEGYFSLEGKTTNERFKEAKNLYKSIKDIDEYNNIINESDKRSRLILTSIAINDALGINNNRTSVDNARKIFSTISDENIDDYKNKMALMSIHGQKKINDIYKAIDKVQKLNKDYNDYSEKNSDYAENVIGTEIFKTIDTVNGFNDQNIINRFSGYEKETKKKEKTFNLSY